MPPRKKGYKNPSEEFPDPGASSPGASSPSVNKGKQTAGAASPNTTAKDALKEQPLYYRKEFPIPITELVIPLASSDVKQRSQPWGLKERYLERQNFPVKNGFFRYIYEAILTETQSVNITHFHIDSRNPQSAISHSKCYIVRILHPQEWGLDPNKNRSLKIPNSNRIQEYNYWNYIEAWTRAFYYQNPTRNHSWLFCLNPKILDTPNSLGFPNWFYHIWVKIGPEPNCLPESIKNLFLPWTEVYPKLYKKKEGTDFPLGTKTLFFHTETRMPWIWKWDLEVQLNELQYLVLNRTFWYRWWNQCDIKPLVESISTAITEFRTQAKKHEVSQPVTVSTNTNFIDLLRQQLEIARPNASQAEIQIELLDLVKNQFLAIQQFSQPTPGVNPLEVTITSGSQFTCLGGEAQNPEDRKSVV